MYRFDPRHVQTVGDMQLNAETPWPFAQVHYLQAGPTSSTLAQHCINVIQMFCVYWEEDAMIICMNNLQTTHYKLYSIHMIHTHCIMLIEHSEHLYTVCVYRLVLSIPYLQRQYQYTAVCLRSGYIHEESCNI